MESTLDTLLPQSVPEIGTEKEKLNHFNNLPHDNVTMNLENLKLDKLLPQVLPHKLLHHSLPVTCLKLLDRVLLVASEGPSILMKMVYFDNQRFRRFQLFPSQFVISGVEFVHNPVLECGDNLDDWYKKSDKTFDHIYIGYVWAGSLGTLVRVTRSIKSGVKLEDVVADTGEFSNKFFNLDFIPVAAKWLEGGNVLALLSVLNYVVMFERQESLDSPGNFTELKEVARIKCDKSETLFSGTIFGTVTSDLRVFAGTVFNGVIVWDVVKGKPCIMHELKCHDGIVFSVEYYANRKLLLSTSDDRTVAVWQFSGSNGQEKAELLHKFYGHDARVWRALSVHGYIVSVGESSEVRVNILKDGREHKTWKAHDGSPIFTCAYDEDAEILYTGGNNGAVRKWPKWWYQVNPRVLPFDVVLLPDQVKQDVSLVKETGRWSENKDFPKLAVLLDINHVIVAMESGRIVGFNWEGKQYDLLHDPQCEGYQIIRMSPHHKILAVAGNDGHFYLAEISLSVNQSSKVNVLHAKKLFMTKVAWNIITMIWLDVTRLLLVCFNRAIVLLIQESENGDALEVQFIQTFNLNLPRPGVPAAVEILGKYVVMGDELGSLHMLRYHKTNEVIEKFENAHKDGCTSLLYHESTLYSSGRDGQVKSFKITIADEDDLEVKFIPVGSFLMPFEWTTGIYVNMGQMLCCGFQKEEFLVYSVNERRTLVKVLCGGGGNKKWDFKYGHGTEGSSNASFTFIKDKEIYYTFFPMEGLLKNTLKDGLHSRTINCALHLSSLEHKIDYITGSEDGSLKWFQWDVANESILSVESMENHVSSVRCIWKITTASQQHFLFSGGGRSQLCIYKIDLINRKLELLNEIILVKTTFKQSEGDVRIMDIFVVERDNNELWCFSACSDGVVRVLYFNTNTNKFKIAGLLNGNAHAVMRIQFLKTDISGCEVLIAGVTSNGYLMLWTWRNSDATGSTVNANRMPVPEMPCVFQMLLRRTAFLSMKASLSIVQNDYEWYSIVCGGDDCSVSLWTLRVPTDKDSLKYTVEENWSQDQCQRGAVVGAEIFKQSVYTLSNDQIVGVWNLQGELVSKVYSGVSDCQGFVVDYNNNCVMCYGKGISWIPLTND